MYIKVGHIFCIFTRSLFEVLRSFCLLLHRLNNIADILDYTNRNNSSVPQYKDKIIFFQSPLRRVMLVVFNEIEIRNYR